MKINRCQDGFTLIEILIVVTISAIMLLGVAKIFDITKRGYIATEAESRMQENARLAMYFIGRDFRQAGQMGCRNGLSAQAGSVLGTENLLANPTNHENNYFSGSGTSTTLHVTVAARVASATIPAWQRPNTIVGTDAITIRGAFSPGRLTTAVASNTSIPLDNADNGVRFFEVGDRLLITDCKKVSVVSVSAQTAALITANTNLMEPYSTGSEVFKLDSAIYYISNNPSGVPSLFRSVNGAAGVELVEGIENLRLLFGEDTNSDARPDRFVPAGTGGLIMDNVVALRVSLLVRSLRNDVDLGVQADSFSLLGTTAINTNDALRRDVYTMTISFRNSVIGI